MKIINFNAIRQNAYRLLLYVLILACILLVSCCSLALSSGWACEVLGILVDISAILFGVYGVWLGLFYRPDSACSLRGKKEKDLENLCKEIIVAERRFGNILRGLVVSASVLVVSMLARALHVPSRHIICSYCPVALPYLKCAFFFVVGLCVVAQLYAILIAIAPMYEANRRMKEAKDDAEFISSL